jgi:thiol-disulfide isomerase/thioredoxin
MTNNNSQKGFAMPIVIAIIALVVVVGGIGYFTTRTKPSPTTTIQTTAGEKKLPDGTMVKPDGTMVKPDGTMVKPTSTNTEKKTDGAMMSKYTGTVLAGKSASLLDYTKTDYDAAIVSDKLVVLYFYANWCPICKNETANALYPAFNELTTDKVIGIRINYKDSDTDTDEENLARQYGIPYQHTKVFVRNGKQLLKAPDSWDKTRYLTEINKALAQ